MSLFDRLAEGLLGVRRPSRQYVKTPPRPVKHKPSGESDKPAADKMEESSIESKIQHIIPSFKGALNSNMAEMNEKIDELQVRLEESIKSSGDNYSQELKNTIAEEVASLKQEVKDSFLSVEDKIHSENVKTYRNIQALVSEIDKKSAKEVNIDAKFASVKRLLTLTTWTAIGTFLVLVIYVLHGIGVF
ncbi:MAG: hypothetical protein K6E39_05405 [Lachnospiraceae bacterium]|nr:hypothetical protein [Lachnospiraceae bacterium]